MNSEAKLRPLYGLLIHESADRLQREDADVLWSRNVVAELKMPALPFTCGEARPSGAWTRQVFVSGDTAYCSFETSADGATVRSEALSSVEESDLFEIFSETIMRTVLYRKELISFHAAALSKNGRSILLMGRKGAGKSTLSAMLQQCGWTLLADDLVRIRQSATVWHAVPGVQRSKLKADALQALGYSLSEATLRWRGELPPDAAVEEKYTMRIAADSETKDQPLAAVFSLQPRGSSIERVSVVKLPVPLQVHALAEHLTRDPLFPAKAPPRASASALSGLVAQAGVYQVTLPNDFAKLRDSAMTLETFVSAPSSTG